MVGKTIRIALPSPRNRLALQLVDLCWNLVRQKCPEQDEQRLAGTSENREMVRIRILNSRTDVPFKSSAEMCGLTTYFPAKSFSIVPIGRKSRLSILGSSMKPYFR